MSITRAIYALKDDTDYQVFDWKPRPWLPSANTAETEWTVLTVFELTGDGYTLEVDPDGHAWLWVDGIRFGAQDVVCRQNVDGTKVPASVKYLTEVP